MRFLILISSLLLSLHCFAENPLIIYTAEMGVGKFHRGDNKVHPYDAQSAWLPYVMADGANTDQVITVKNADGSYTVFFSTLEEMLNSVVQISKTENRKVSVLNIHGHGLPGRMWFPKDASALNGFGCYEWREAASGSDQANLDQYYTPVSASQIQQIRDISNSTGFSMPCTTGLKEWTVAVQKNQDFKAALADNAKLHFLSCVVGLGSAGDAFAKGMAALLFSQGQVGQIQTSMNFGLGDWSMNAGMGFWDYLNNDQLNRDNSNYAAHHKDAEIAQQGSIRLATWSNNAWNTSVVGDQSTMKLNFDNLTAGVPVLKSDLIYSDELPTTVRIPGTKVDLPVYRDR